VIFYISILNDRQRIRLKVERFEDTDSFEKYRVTARNKSFVLQSNRPLLREKGLKHKPIDWKVIEGGFDNSHFLQKIIKEIESKEL